LLNCGSCGNACSANQHCIQGRCMTLTTVAAPTLTLVVKK
jgi:hypothetical protein